MNTELYHILNRGVEKRNIFMDKQDFARFVHNMYEFNDTAPADNTARHQMSELRSRSYRDRIVDIHGWCLMRNHYHLLLSERIDGGLTLFLRKLNIGFAMYFNEKYKRSGTLFQGRTKKIHISSDAHFLHILHYIHLNPLDYHNGSKLWRAGEIDNSADALNHLENYRWSSYLDYCGKKNFPSIINTNLFSDVFGNYEQVIKKYLKDIELSDVEQFIIEK